MLKCKFICVTAIFVFALSGCGASSKDTIDVSKKGVQDTVPQGSAFLEESEEEETKASDKDISQGGASQKEVRAQEEQELVVYVCGAVNVPGIYTLSGKARMMDAVNAAGGMSDQADVNVLNLAQFISDGQMIRIPAVGEIPAEEFVIADEASSGQMGESDTGGKSSADDDKVDLNSADETQLMTIPGVGAAKAQAIIRYREEHGRFGKIEELMQISGIKEASFRKMEPYVCVK